MSTLTNPTLTETYTINYSEMTRDLSLKPYSLLNFLQDIASNNAQELGFGYSFMSSNKLAWFLIKYKMEFYEYPVGLYEITIKTTPRGYNRMFAYREFEIYSKDKLIGKILSMWSIFDFKTQSTLQIKDVVISDFMQPYQKKEEDLTFDKIKMIENIKHQREFFVRYNDLDVNGHANNGNYIIWALEALDYDFQANHKIKLLDMMYKKEAKYDDKIVSQVDFLDDCTTLHSIKNQNNEELFCAKIQWM